MNNSRFLILDLARGVAAFGVLCFHVFFFSPYPQLLGFYLLVDFFFVLSGFVLLHSYPMGRNNILRESRRFLIKRFFRLWPIVFCVVFLAVIPFYISKLLEGNSDLYFREDPNKSWPFIVAAFLFLQIVVSQSLLLVVPLWSLSAEWLTNIIYLPILIVRKTLVTMSLIFMGFCMIVYGLTSDTLWISYVGPTRGWEALGRAIVCFGFGVLVRQNLDKLSKYRSNTFVILSLSLTVLLLFSWPMFGFNNLYFAPFVFSFLVLQLSNRNISPASKVGKFSVLAGTYSFGIYAYHQLLINWFQNFDTQMGFGPGAMNWARFLIFKTLVVSLASLLLTYYSIKWVERPIRRAVGRKFASTENINQ